MRHRDPFESSKRRLLRAKQHIRDLDSRIEKFFKKQPHKRAVDLDADGLTELHKVKLTKPVPAQFSDRTAETIEALRSALDQTGYAVAILAGAVEPKSAYFPIAETDTGLEMVIKGRCKDLPPDIVSFFRSFKPYKGGNDPIWTLNRASTVAKHRALIRVGMSVLKISVNSPSLLMGRSIPAPKWDSEKNEVIFGIVGPGGKFQYDFEFTFFIAFDEIEIIEGMPVVPILATMTGEVDRVIRGTEAECRRIGLLKSRMVRRCVTRRAIAGLSRTFLRLSS